MRPYVDFALHCQTFALKLRLKTTTTTTKTPPGRMSFLQSLWEKSFGARRRWSASQANEKGTGLEEAPSKEKPSWFSIEEARKSSRFQSNANKLLSDGAPRPSPRSAGGMELTPFALLGVEPRDALMGRASSCSLGVTTVCGGIETHGCKRGQIHPPRLPSNIHSSGTAVSEPSRHRS